MYYNYHVLQLLCIVVAIVILHYFRCSPSFFAEERQVLYRKRNKLRKLQQRKLTHLDDISDMPKDIPMPMIIGTSITG